MNQASNIRERMMVHARGEGSMGGSSGVHIGTVDHIEGDMIKLTRNDDGSILMNDPADFGREPITLKPSPKK